MMRYLIMVMIVIGLAVSDVITGMILAHIRGDYCSKVMRKGGLNKLAELVVMVTVCGLEVGFQQLGIFYDAPELARNAGTFTAVSIFLYIVVMELISIFENFAEMNPEAPWARAIAKKLRGMESRKDGEHDSK